jgi:hypothetical protein
MRIVLFALALSIAGCANTSKAEDYANDYASDNFASETVNNVKCESGDSDNNGRVRCNISLSNGDVTHVENVECPSSWLWQPLKTTCVGIKGN